MKLFTVAIFFAVLAVAVVKANITTDLEKYAEVCMPQSKVTPEDLDKFLGQGMHAEDATDGVKCHIMCIMEQNGHFKDGVVDEQHVLNSLKDIAALKDRQEEIAAALTACKNEKGDNNCDTAFKVTMCFGETDVGKLALASY